MKRLVVAIDGPAGAGKTTVSQRVADALGFTLVDTGALYRAVALAARERGVSWEDGDAVALVAAELATRGALRFERDGDRRQRLLLDSRDISSEIRTPEISQGASRVSVFPGVRAALLEIQRRAGQGGGVVLEGRDIGTVVFPEAEAKFFLTASVDVRARRRHAELEARGTVAPLEAVEREVIERDERDSLRPLAPLRQAPDAILVDSSSLSIDEVVALMVRHVRAIAAE